MAAGDTTRRSSAENRVRRRPPSLSVIILTLDSQEFVRECIKSLEPLDPRTEIVVVDGGSRDSTVALIQQLLPGCTLCSAPGTTIPQARNVGLRAATGEYVHYLDSDDRMRRDAMQDLLGLLEDTSPSFVVTHSARINRAGQPAGMRRTRYPDPYGGLLWNPVSTLGMVCRRDLLLALGGFSESFRVAEDYDLWLRVFEAARGQRLDVLLGDYRVRRDSASHSDVVRSRLFGAKAAMAAATRRRMPRALRTILLGYWILGLLHEFHLVPDLRPRPAVPDGLLAGMLAGHTRVTG